MKTAVTQQAVEAALLDIASRHGGRLDPHDVIEAARDPASPLHPCFTWNVGEAARKRLLDEARALIRSVKIRVVVDERTVESVAYVRDPQMPRQKAGYVYVPALRAQEDAARAAVMQEFKFVAAALRRAMALSKVLGMADEVSHTLHLVENLHEKARRGLHS